MLRPIMLALALIVAIPVLSAMLIDTGEVVVLETRDARGHLQETQLWIVDLDGAQYIRAGNPHTHWADRMRGAPTVGLVRGGAHTDCIAEEVSDPVLVERVAAAMAAKYGSADRIWSLASDRAESAVFRLTPAPARRAHP